jgi:cell wall-associated NlpC family hydrolase
MTPAEFVNRAVGLPWVKWRSDWQACDCFGLVVLWHREVLGVDLGDVPHEPIADGFAHAMEQGNWIQVATSQAGATAWMAWRDNAPTHCGIVLDPLTVLHAEGCEERGGSVKVSRLAAVERMYGAITYHQYIPC